MARKRNLHDEPRQWTSEHPDGGRRDADGVEWFACDPYPTWYRWEGDKLIVGGWGTDEPRFTQRAASVVPSSPLAELERAIEQFDAVPKGRYWPVQTSAVIDCARDVVKEWRDAQR